ncbi:hypothetical protein ACFPH6_21055 [Streptomyces xiangluensis]|uniref:Uncharacterized protein n=1 Tax=Streptomyces xiangluensis TaxID=2665720 RepID=A0ABV8YT07_9ACTN
MGWNEPRTLLGVLEMRCLFTKLIGRYVLAALTSGVTSVNPLASLVSYDENVNVKKSARRAADLLHLALTAWRLLEG